MLKNQKSPNSGYQPVDNKDRGNPPCGGSAAVFTTNKLITGIFQAQNPPYPKPCKNCGYKPRISEPPIPNTILVSCPYCTDEHYCNQVTGETVIGAISNWNDLQDGDN